MVLEVKSRIKRSLLLALAFVLILSLAPLRASASDDVLFYNPDGSSGCGRLSSVELEGDDNIEQALRFYIGKGLTLTQAAGILGNFRQESGVNPKSLEPSTTVDAQGFDFFNQDVSASVARQIQGVLIHGTIPDKNGKTDLYPNNPNVNRGFGLAQWSYHSRQQRLIDFAQEYKSPITNLLAQLEFTWRELEVHYPSTLERLKAETDIINAVVIFHNEYEGSNDTPDSVRNNRGQKAIDIYESYKHLDSLAVGGGAPCGDGQASAYTDDNFIIFNQNDPQWNDIIYGNHCSGSPTIGSSGCGPSAMAMIITALTGQIVTPKETAAYAEAQGMRVCGAGSSWGIASIAENWGLRYEGVTDSSVANINRLLREGKLIIVAGGGPAPFTSGGHFIMIRGVTANGMWLIGDSNNTKGINNSMREWNPTEITSYWSSGSLRAVYK